jgi:single-stranded DNA-binding protein
MASVEELTLIGHVGNVSMGHSKAGNAWVSFGVAISKWNPTTNTESTKWFNCKVFGDKAASVIDKNLITKGQLIYVKGTVELEEYQAKDGTTKNSLVVFSSYYKTLSPRPEQAVTDPADDEFYGNAKSAADLAFGDGEELP